MTAQDERRIVYLPIDDIPDAERNPKLHDLPTLDASLTRWGFVDLPTIDDRTGRLVSGHGRKEALIARRDSGGDVPKGIKVVRGVWKCPVVMGWASDNDDDAAGYLVTANRSSELGGWDLEELSHHLGELDDLDGVGFDADDVEQLVRKVNFEAKPKPEEFKVIVDCTSARHRKKVLATLEAAGIMAREA